MENHKSFWGRHALVLHVGIVIVLTFFCVFLPLLLWTHATVDRSLLLALLVVFAVSIFIIMRHNLVRRQAEAGIARRLAMQRLVTSISLRLLHTDVDKLDSVVGQALEELGEAMDSDHVLLSQVTREGTRMVLAPISSWHAVGAPETEYSGLIALNRWNWLERVVSELRTEAFDSTAALPPAAAAESADWARAGIRSFAAIPVKGKRMTVFFWFLAMRRTKAWTPEEVQMLGLACGIVLSALENRFAEVKIRQSEERFRVALQDSPVSVFSQDVNLRYSWVYNQPSWMNALISLIGQGDADLYPPDVAERLTAVKREVLASGGLRREEVTVATGKDKTFCYDITMEPLYDLSGRIAGITSAAVDISATKRAGEERIILEGSAREAQKLECLAVMAGGIAHDFNNLLMVILGNAELAMRSKTLPSDVTESLGAITAAGQRASELSRMMLVYSGRSGVNPRPVILGELLSDMKSLVETLVPKNITLDYRPAGLDLLADMDTSQIQQLVTHLVTNAVEAVGSSEGGVRVCSGSRMMSRQDFQSAPGGLGQNRPDGLYAFIEVSDTGCGMDEESRMHIFEPFFSTKFAGRGLGLSVVLGITRAHGGIVTVDSQSGSGTRVTVYFPAKERPVPESVEPLAPPAEAEANRSKKNLETLGTILVVDDEDCIRDLVQHVLEMAGYSVLSAGDGVIGLSVFHQKADRVSAAILDLKMPRMDGYELIRSLHRTRPDLPIIVFSGYSSEDATGHLAGSEISAFIQKPCETEVLLRTLKSVLARPTATDPLFLL